ncbi:MAG: T9SS type A sorting domain-containing protein [Sphingobacteriales bacterium JAD_PAG50586_3]|nr:MAG: T9SS type A sorting domain-containing protein [Sphingobacteriales bacterium JAD_PAG50586_3]
MRKAIFLFYILIATKANAQNLIKNPSFEEMSSCPYDTIPTNYTGFSYFYIEDWTVPNDGSPDLMSQCFYDTILYDNNCMPPQAWTYSLTNSLPGNWQGFQYPQNGKNYVGLISFIPNQNNYGIEYIGSQLINPLNNKKYCMSAYLSLADSRNMLAPYLCSPPPPENYSTSCLALNSLQVYLSTTAIPYQNNFEPLPYTPQIELKNTNQNYLNDTTNWMLVYGEYSAIGDEQYFYLGNFNQENYEIIGDDTSSVNGFVSYYYIDNVSLFEVKEPLLKADTFICNGDTATLTIEGDVLEYWWYEQDSPNTILGAGSTLKVSPWQTTTYTVKTKSCSVVFEKNITVTVCNNQPVIKIYPNPAHDFVTINLQNVDLDNSMVSMYNAVGQLVYKDTITNNQFSINTTGLAGGLYTLDISQVNESKARQKIVVLH